MKIKFKKLTAFLLSSMMLTTIFPASISVSAEEQAAGVGVQSADLAEKESANGTHEQETSPVIKAGECG